MEILNRIGERVPWMNHFGVRFNGWRIKMVRAGDHEINPEIGFGWGMLKKGASF